MKSKIITFIIYILSIIVSGYFLSSVFSEIAKRNGLESFNSGSVLLVLKTENETIPLFQTDGYIIILTLVSLVALMNYLIKINHNKKKQIKDLIQSQQQSITITKSEEEFRVMFEEFSRKYLDKSIRTNLFGIQLYRYRLGKQEDKYEIATECLSSIVEPGKSLTSNTAVKLIDKTLFRKLIDAYDQNTLKEFVNEHKKPFVERKQVPQKDKLELFYILRVANVIQNGTDVFVDGDYYSNWIKQISNNGKVEAIINYSLTNRPYYFENGDRSKFYIAWKLIDEEDKLQFLNEKEYMIIMAFETPVKDKHKQAIETLNKFDKTLKEYTRKI